MKDAECVKFLQWALPRLHMRWPGFRKVRKQVCKRLEHRLRTLDLASAEAYCDYLESHADEWQILDGLSRVTISRFYREKAVFQFIEQRVIPTLVEQAVKRGDRQLRVLSLGSASGEEPYTLAILWKLQFQMKYPEFGLEIVATDSNPDLIRRSLRACYPYSSVRNLPESWRRSAFDFRDDVYCLNPVFQHGVQFIEQDVREAVPDGPYDLVLCRNLAFTYYDESLQQLVLDKINHVLCNNGALVIGIHEELPGQQTAFRSWSDRLRIFCKSAINDAWVR
ncbi:CheR family methyltransferase [Kaarinaea lacus]